jgi:glycosyltransferase involved in cell wall biosynthesis
MTTPVQANGRELPLVTAIALCYNHERFILECLESIKAQQYPNLQLIITDDASKDASAELIRKWVAENASLHPTFIHNAQNQGVCKALNSALAAARGKYIAMTATDDVWVPGRLGQQVPVMEKLPEEIGVLYSDAYQIDEAGNPLPNRFIESYRTFEQMPEGDIQDPLWVGNFIPAMTTLVRRSVYEKVGYYDESLFYEDWDMWLRIAQQFRFAFFPNPAARYRIVRTSMSKASVGKMDTANELIFIKHLAARKVPKAVRNKAFNYVVRRAYRQGEAPDAAGRELLRRMIALYKSPRLMYGWLLHACGFRYETYEATFRSLRNFKHTILPSRS